jgi:hypothetical protein
VQIQKRWDTAAGRVQEHYALLDMWIGGGASPARLRGGSVVLQDIPTKNIH